MFVVWMRTKADERIRRRLKRALLSSVNIPEQPEGLTFGGHALTNTAQLYIHRPVQRRRGVTDISKGSKKR